MWESRREPGARNINWRLFVQTALKGTKYSYVMEDRELGMTIE